MRKRKKNKWLKWAIIALGVLFIGAGVFFFLNSKKKEQAAESNLPKTYTVESVSQIEVIEVSGNIEPVRTEDLKFFTSGRIVSLFIEEGEYAAKGTLVAQLDDIKEVYDLESLEYNIEQEKLSGNRRKLKLLEIEREMKLGALEDRKLYSSISGIVSLIDVSRGEYVQAGELVARIIDISSMKAEVEIDEIDVPLIASGQKVRFFFDALPDLEITGRVSSLPLEGRVTNQGIAVLDVELMIDSPPREILPSYSFSAEIVVSEEKTVLVLNEKAIIERNDRTFVLLPPEDEGKPTPKPVKTEKFGDGRVKIVSGLSEGDTVLSVQQMMEADQKRTGSRNPLEVFGISPRMPGGGRRPPHPGGGR